MSNAETLAYERALERIAERALARKKAAPDVPYQEPDAPPPWIAAIAHEWRTTGKVSIAMGRSNNTTNSRLRVMLAHGWIERRRGCRCMEWRLREQA